MKNFYLLIIAIFSLSFSYHKHYVSLCEIEYVKEKKELQIIVSVFTDDLQKAIAKEKNIDFQIDKKDSTIDSICFSYLKNHLKIDIDNNALNYNYIGKEFEGNKTFFYLEASNINQPQILQLKNTLLIKQFKEQKNIVKLNINNKHKSFYLNRNQHIAHYQL